MKRNAKRLRQLGSVLVEYLLLTGTVVAAGSAFASFYQELVQELAKGLVLR